MHRPLRLLAITGSLTAAILGLNLPADSRTPWEMQHPPAPQADGAAPAVPGQMHMGIPAQFQSPKQLPSGFWQGQQGGIANRLQSGTMLTAVMDDEISSGRNKAGDLFALNLDDGFIQGGMQVIPRGSRIVGAITHVVPAKTQRAGNPGSLQVSLQSLVLPDGTHIPFSGFIANNPNHAYKNPPKKRTLGFDIKDTGSHMAGMMSSFTNGIGFMYAKQYRGNEFYLDKGELVPVRLNKPLLIPEQYVQAAQPVPVTTPINGNLPPGMVPGMVGTDNVGQFQAPTTAPPVPGLLGDADPFKPAATFPPTARPLSEMPEPF